MLTPALIHTTEADINRMFALDSRRRGVSPVVLLYTYSSPVLELWSDTVRQAVWQDVNGWREAALLYLEVSPRFFRSGSLRDHVCCLIKQCHLSVVQRSRVQNSLLHAVVKRPSVGRFRYDCRLACAVADAAFIAHLDHLAKRKGAWVGPRARRMLKAIAQHGSV